MPEVAATTPPNEGGCLLFFGLVAFVAVVAPLVFDLVRWYLR